MSQELALLGVGNLNFVDDEELAKPDRNRNNAAQHDDPIPGSPKVTLGSRMVAKIDPSIEVTEIHENLVNERAFEAVKAADAVFGCLDHDGPRAILNELCLAYGKPLIDLASDVPEDGAYGGRACVLWRNEACLHCLGLLDPDDVRRYLTPEAQRQDEDAVYGVRKDWLGETGPSVSPINTVVSGLGVTEFMVAITGMRPPIRLMTYRAHFPRVSVSSDSPQADCPICKTVRNKAEVADVERYLRIPHLRKRR